MKKDVLIDKAAAIDALQRGAVLVMPTDTVYGLVAQAASHQAVAKLYKLKRREGKPGTIIAASVEQLINLGIETSQLTHVAHFWPAALSIVLQDIPDLAYLDQGKNSLAVRVPNDPVLRDFLSKSGPLLTTSANMPSESTATTIEEAYNYFGDAVDGYIDGGVIAPVPSTVIRINRTGKIEILRQGAVQL